MEIERDRTAALFIDFQVDVCAEDGLMVSQEPDVLATFQAARNAAGAVLEGLRQSGHAHRVFMRHAFATGYPELAGARLVGIEQYVQSKGAFIADGPGAAWVPELRPESTETVFTKTTISAFSGTSLDRWLRKRQVDTVAIAGVVTHYAVLAAALAAYDIGYRVIVLKDCCASADPQRHETALSILQPLAEIATGQDFLAAL